MGVLMLAAQAKTDSGSSFSPTVFTWLGAVAALFAIIGSLVAVWRWVIRRRHARKPDAYPVRFRCWEHTEFHPSSGYHEGLVFEVFNHSDHDVTVNGFGLDVTYATNDEWHEYEQAAHRGGGQCPVRLGPRQAVEGSIDVEALGDEIYTQGKSSHRVDDRPYVEVAGFGLLHVGIGPAPSPNPQH